MNTLRNEVYQTVQSSELIVKKVKKGLMITIGSFLILRPYALPRDDAEVYDVSLPHFFSSVIGLGVYRDKPLL